MGFYHRKTGSRGLFASLKYWDFFYIFSISKSSDFFYLTFNIIIFDALLICGFNIEGLFFYYKYHPLKRLNRVRPKNKLQISIIM